MKKFRVILLALFVGIILAACTNQKTEETKETSVNDKVTVVATNSIIADMVTNVGGELVEIHSIVPVGTDPHEYEPLPEDIAKSTEADIIFFNGLNLETGGNGWFSKLMETSKKVEGTDYFAVSEGVEPKYLTSKGQESEQDPHAWLDISNGIIYVNNIAKVLEEKDPANKEIYKKNAEAYVKKLEKLHEEAKVEFATIPKEKALLVTSEGAFKYFSAAYGLEAAYIWEINTESQGTPEQMSQVIERIRETKVPALFLETSVDARSMESVAKETNLPIYAKIFTDSLAKKGEDGDTYESMMTWNLTKIRDGLLEK